MIRGVENVGVIESLVVDKGNLVEGYKMEEECGKMGVRGESECREFRNGMKDKKMVCEGLGGRNEKVV